MVMKSKGGDLKAEKLSVAAFLPTGADDEDVTRLGYGRKHKTPRNITPSTRNPAALMAHCQPNFGRSDLNIIDNVTPPKEEPDNAMPIASPRRRLKSFPMTASATVDERAPPIPPRTPKQRMKCQYSLHSPRRKNTGTIVAAEIGAKSFVPYASIRGPA
nr:uncharacterized protein CTRU02_07497 [Colletotrichum truncatum]KAF6791157.1 hypothetical protein CTRU02_07497 [Colletotrichum truncatum]